MLNHDGRLWCANHGLGVTYSAHLGSQLCQRLIGHTTAGRSRFTHRLSRLRLQPAHQTPAPTLVRYCAPTTAVLHAVALWQQTAEALIRVARALCVLDWCVLVRLRLRRTHGCKILHEVGSNCQVAKHGHTGIEIVRSSPIRTCTSCSLAQRGAKKGLNYWRHQARP